MFYPFMIANFWFEMPMNIFFGMCDSVTEYAIGQIPKSQFNAK